MSDRAVFTDGGLSCLRKPTETELLHSGLGSDFFSNPIRKKCLLSDCLLHTTTAISRITIKPSDMLLSAAHKLLPTDPSKRAL
jgi:hypothetical protein